MNEETKQITIIAVALGITILGAIALFTNYNANILHQVNLEPRGKGLRLFPSQWKV